MCKENYEYFKLHIEELRKKYGEQFVVIKEQKIIGVYDTFDLAYNETIKNEKLGSFLIQQCVMNEEENSEYFYSNNVVFA